MTTRTDPLAVTRRHQNPWLLVIILLALLTGLVTAWTWAKLGTTTLEALKTGGGADAFTFGAGNTIFYLCS